MELRPLTREDRRLYERIYTERRMWAELGGVVVQDMAAKLERDVASVEADRHWVLVIVTEDGTVSVWDHEWDGQTIGEIGWMVLPEHQGRGLASAGVAEALRRADETAPLAGAPCLSGDEQRPFQRALSRHSFALRGEIDYVHRERRLRVNHWLRDLSAAV